MADPRDFLLNTDYEMDKIIYFKSGEFTKSTTFNHGLEFAPLIFGVWSTDSDFSSSNALGFNASTSEPGDTPPLGVSAEVSGYVINPESQSQVKLTAHGEGENTTKIYYRLYGFAPPEYTGNTPSTAKDAKQFILNTDYNYRKLKASGIFTQTGDEYTHNLGYYPHVMAWLRWTIDSDPSEKFYLQPLVFSSLFTEVHLDITTTKIKAYQPTIALSHKIYWRIYYDET